jgi:hypothetical protein
MSEGHEVVVCDNFDDFYVGKEGNLAEHIHHARFSLHRIDILDLQSLLECVRGVDLSFILPPNLECDIH